MVRKFGHGLKTLKNQHVYSPNQQYGHGTDNTDKEDIMKIQLNDKHYYWITCIVKSKDGKPYEKRVSGYAATFGDAVNSFIEKTIKQSSSEIYVS